MLGNGLVAIISFIAVRESEQQLGERQTLDHKVAGSILTRGQVLCP